MKRSLRITTIVLGVIALALLIVAIVLTVMTRTEFGLERIRTFAVGWVGDRFQGKLRIGSISTGSGLLGDVMIRDLGIDDPKGDPVLRADSARLRYKWRTLAGGRIVIDHLVLYDPELYITKLPGDTAWNYEYAFADTSPGKPGPRKLVVLEDVTLKRAHVEVKFPFTPDTVGVPADTSRMILQPAPGGKLRVFRFDSLDARVPRALWSSPDEPGKLFRIASLDGRGFIWKTPFRMSRLRGTVAVQDSTVSFEIPSARMGGSPIHGYGKVVVGKKGPRYDLQLAGRDLRFRDFRWLYPPMPTEGGGRMTLRIQTQPSYRTLWLVKNARIRTKGTDIAGSFGMVTGDSVYFTQVDLRAAPIDMDVIRSLLPGKIPIEGLVVGELRVEGPVSSLRTDGDLRLASGSSAGSAIRWAGTVNLKNGFGARGLRADVTQLDLALLDAWYPGMHARGRLTGNIEASGRVGGVFHLAGLLRHRVGDGPESVVQGSGDWSGTKAMTARIDARTVDLASLGASVPALAGLRGYARGPVTISGPPSDLRVVADLETAAGPVSVRGRMDAAARVPAYAFDATTSDFRLDRFVDGLPETRLTGSVAIAGRGTDPAAAELRLVALLDSASVGGTAVWGGALHAGMRGGIATVDSLRLDAAAGSLVAQGAFGMAPGKSGTLRFQITGDSLRALQPLLFPDAAPGAVAGDSIPLGGEIVANGVLTGGRSAFDLGADLVVRQGAFGQHFVDGTARVDARGVGTPAARVEIHAAADSVVAFGRPFTATRAELTAQGERATLSLGTAAPGGRSYAFSGDLVRRGKALEIGLAHFEARDAEHRWALTHPATLNITPTGTTLSPLEVAGGSAGRLFTAQGTLPWTRAAADTAGFGARPVDFRIDATGIPLEDWLAIGAPGLEARGTLSGSLVIRGPAATPRAESHVEIGDLHYRDLELQRVGARATYADRHMELHAAAVDPTGRMVLSADGVVPVDLSLAPGAPRHTGERVDVAIRADALPLALPFALVRGVRNVEGRADGTLQVGGTTADPELSGSASVRDGAFDAVAGGIRLRGIAGAMRLAEGNVVEVDGRAASGNGSALVRGTVTFDRLSDPKFDLRADATGLEAARRRDIELVASGQLRLGGRFRAPILSGAWRVDRGALYLTEIIREHRLVDPLESDLLFNVVDTTRVAIRQFLLGESEFIRNMRVDATVDVGRDFWLRSPELNVEVSGQLGIRFDRQAEDLRMTGTLAAVRGTYQLFYRQFEVERGSVEFLGGAGVNPNLDIIAGYRARDGRGDVLDIDAVVSGTLLDPRVHLTSDVQPPIAESDLASYLLFGRATSQLASGERGALNDLAGAQQLGLDLIAPSALGYGAAILESVGRSFGVDYVSLTAGESNPAVAQDRFGFLQGTELELGRYVSDRLFLALSRQITGDGYGARVEWRMDPIVTSELFYENGLYRGRRFGLPDVLKPRKYGIFLYREWGF